MPQFISLLHRTPSTNMFQSDKLFNSIRVGKYLIDAQASSSHACSPRTEGLPAYMYDAWEVAIYNENDEPIPPTIMHDMKGIDFDEEMKMFYNIPTHKLQLLFDELTMYEKEHFFSLTDLMLSAADTEYLDEIQEQCELTHALTNEPYWQRIAMRRMLVMMHGVK